MKVARKAPAMPSTVVRMNPPGLLGPGDSSRAIIPATKPTMMIQRMPLISVVLLPKKPRFKRLELDPSRQFVFGRQPSVRRQMVDDIGQILAETVEQVVARQPALRGERVDLVGAERIGEIAGGNRFVGARAYP